jgi:hypothetical protein
MVDAIENAFGMLAKDKVDVPIPMHIGIHVRKMLIILAGPFQTFVDDVC